MQVQILMLFNSGFIFSELCLYISIFLHYPPSFSTFPHKICVTYWGSARLSSTSPVIMTPIRRELQIDSVYLCYLILCTNYQNISRYKVFISLSSLEMKWVFFNLCLLLVLAMRIWNQEEKKKAPIGLVLLSFLQIQLTLFNLILFSH